MKAGIKAAIVATTAAASLVAVSPLAFAGDYDRDRDGRGHHSRHHDGDDDDDDNGRGHRSRGGDNTECAQDNSVDDGRGGGRGGLINISDVNVQVPVQLCGNDILSGVLGILSSDQRNN